MKVTLQLCYIDKNLGLLAQGLRENFFISDLFSIESSLYSNIRIINTNKHLALRAGVPDHLEAVQAGWETGTAPATKEAETSSQEDRDPAGGGDRHGLDDPPAGGADHVLWLVCQVDWRLCFIFQGGNRIELVRRI